MTDYSNIKVKDLKREYDKDFVPTEDYLDHMPDLQNSQYESTIPIQKVGIGDMEIPLKIKQKDGDIQEVKANVTGTVSLEADKKGINMSRILRTFYKFINEPISMDKVGDILKAYKKDLQSFDAHITVEFPYRLKQYALRSVDEKGDKNWGWIYYNVKFDMNLDRDGSYRKLLILDYRYSSACPCSYNLTQYMRLTRGIDGVSHSQKSTTRIYCELNDDLLWIEDLVDACKKAQPTEEQVFVKRIDECAFSELNGTNLIFCEDAARRFANQINKLSQVKDYKIICNHDESLHPHFVVSVLLKGIKNTHFTTDVSTEEYRSLKG